MDRYVVREPRVVADYPQGNQMITFSATAGANNIIPPDNIYYSSSYGTEIPNMQRVTSSGYVVPLTTQPSFSPNHLLPQGQVVSGIDPRYLSGFSDSNAQFIVTGQQIQEHTHAQVNQGFGTSYQNRSFMGADRNKPITFTHQMVSNNGENVVPYFEETRQEVPKLKQLMDQSDKKVKSTIQNQHAILQHNTNVPIKNPIQIEIVKNDDKNVVMTRTDRLQALYKSGPRAFSGPVEKVLKWHKSLQDIGMLVLYEIVAKCVSVRPGDSGAKNLVVRDDNGPAMQVVYYEIDFLLPELKLPCTVRVIGRMLAGTSRFQAFNVRPATGDDVAMLARRAAVAAHHVTKLCKEYGKNA